MSTVKQGMMTAADTWRKHLKPRAKRLVAKTERRVSKTWIRKELKRIDDFEQKSAKTILHVK